MRAALALRRYFAVPVIASACAGSALRSMVEMRGATGSFVLCRGGKVLRMRSESSEACARKYEAISMMLSWLMHEPHGGSCGWDQARNCSEDESAESYCSSFSGIWRNASNNVCFGHLIGPFSSGKAISQDFSADEIQASISSAVAVTNTGSQPMP